MFGGKSAAVTMDPYMGNPVGREVTRADRPAARDSLLKAPSSEHFAHAIGCASEAPRVERWVDEAIAAARKKARRTRPAS